MEDDKRRTLLHVVALERRPELLEVLLAQPGMDRRLDATDSARRTALHVAAAVGEAAVVEGLLRAGARVDPLDEVGWAPLHW